MKKGVFKGLALTAAALCVLCVFAGCPDATGSGSSAHSVEGLWEVTSVQEGSEPPESWPVSAMGGLKEHILIHFPPGMVYMLDAVTGDALAVPPVDGEGFSCTITGTTVDMDIEGEVISWPYSISGNTLTLIDNTEPDEPVTLILERVTDNAMSNQVEKFEEYAEGGSLVFPFSFFGDGDSPDYLAVFTVNTFNGSTGTFDLYIPADDTTLNTASGNFATVQANPNTIQFTDVTGTASGLNTYLQNAGGSAPAAFSLDNDEVLYLQPRSVEYSFGLEALYN